MNQIADVIYTQAVVLVVDDEPDLREVICEELESILGCQVLQAENGTKAFELVQIRTVDLILSDIRMPGGSGLELLEKIKKRDIIRPRVILMTGFSDISVAEALNRGADAVLSKPFQLEDLIERVKSSILPNEQKWSRKFHRQVIDHNVEFTLESLGITSSGKALNIGQGGMYVAASDIHVKVNQCIQFKVDLKVNLSTQRWVVAGKGVCRWTRYAGEGDQPSGFGVEFEHLTEESIQSLKKFLGKSQTVAFIPNE